VDESQGGDLLQRVSILRKQLAFELGVLVPPVRVRDNIQLGSQEYVVRMRGVRVAGGEVLPRHLMALDTGVTSGTPEGMVTRDPSFGLRAVWIVADQRTAAETLGWNVVEAPTVLATHFMEIIREHASELLTPAERARDARRPQGDAPGAGRGRGARQAHAGRGAPRAAAAAREGLSVRDLATVLEVLSDASETTKDPEQLTEHVRRALSTVIAQMLGGEGQTLRAITIGPRLEVALMQLFSPRAREVSADARARGAHARAAVAATRSSPSPAGRPVPAARHAARAAPRRPPPRRTDPAAPARHLARRAADADAHPDPSHLGAERCRLKS
jgi:flagellar biosynthesis protein FlhA